LEEPKMPGGGYGKELAESLDDAEEYRYQNLPHGLNLHDNWNDYWT